MLINRIIEPSIENNLYKGKIVIIFGARQVGKTTLVRNILKNHQEKSGYYNCDEPDVREAFTNKTSTELKNMIGGKKLIVIDEAQRVKNIGLTLKLLIDNYPQTQVIATGSSSFDLSNEIREPLTGRKIEFYLYPFSIAEISQIYDSIEIGRLLESNMIFGMYPEIISNREEAIQNIKRLSLSYAYKDVLQYQKIKNPEVLQKLLQALALQVGNEVSYNELAETVGVDKNTVAGYIQILEKAFIIFRLGPFSRNLRNEIKKLRKIYFFDNGIRNALINNLNPLDLRQDTGALWENFIIAERLKQLSNRGVFVNSYFWRTRQKQEIDYIEERDAKLTAFEFKWNPRKKASPPKPFRDAYPEAGFKLINKDNYFDFIT